MKRERRTDLNILKDVLELCADTPLMKTAIMYRANLSFRQIKIYLGICTDRGLLSNQIEGSRVVYRTTEKGRKLLEAFYSVERLLKEEEHTPAHAIVVTSNKGNKQVASRER